MYAGFLLKPIVLYIFQVVYTLITETTKNGFSVGFKGLRFRIGSFSVYKKLVQKGLSIRARFYNITFNRRLPRCVYCSRSKCSRMLNPFVAVYWHGKEFASRRARDETPTPDIGSGCMWCGFVAKIGDLREEEANKCALWSSPLQRMPATKPKVTNM